MAVRKTRKRRFPMGVLPGLSRFIVSVAMDQLLCLPEPFTPLKGFSCCRQTRPWWLAMVFMSSMVTRLLSMARLEMVKIGASSCCAGATSLCLVLAGMPSFHSASSSSFMKLLTVGRIAPK